MFHLIKRSYSVETIGEEFTRRIFLLNNKGERISPWHDIHLNIKQSKTSYPAFIEISRHQIAKFEVSLKEPHNPIKQDTRKNKHTGNHELRYYAQFPLFNYGCLPQTWENPFEKDVYSDYKGDGDPIDVLEIGMHPLSTGSVPDVKILGALRLIDQGEVDWKILCINTHDPLAKKLHNPYDIEKHYPGKVAAIRTWLEEIKTYDGKARNKVEGEIEGPEFAMKIIEHGHKQWQRVYNGEYKEEGYWIDK